MKKKNIIQSIISRRHHMNMPKEMQKPNDNPEQEMSMDEILASIRRYVDPHHENSVKPHTLSNITVGHTDTLNHSGLNSDRIHSFEQRSSEYTTLRQPKNDVPANQLYREEKKSYQDTASTASAEILKSAPLKEFLKTPSEDRDDDVVRLTSQQNAQRSDYNNNPAPQPAVTDYVSPSQPTVAAPIHTPVESEEYHSNEYYKAEIISQETQKQVRHSFSKLEETLQKKQLPPKKEEPSGNITIDDMFRQLAIPMIKSWIDQNMPTMIEALIEKEIKKITENN